MLKKLIVFVVLFMLMLVLAMYLNANTFRHGEQDETMYFPSVHGYHRISCGHRAVCADAIWLWFVQYYGKHRLTDRKYDHMYHILDIVTTFDPAFIKAYQLGSMLLTHDAQRPDQAKLLLKKGMQANPDSWSLPFYYGFMHFVFLGDYETARAYFRLAAHKPNAPDMPRRWEAYVTYKKQGDLDTALDLWLDLYTTTTNPEEKRVAELYIKDIYMQQQVHELNESMQRFKEQSGRDPATLEELIVQGYLDSLPQEPHGGYYTIENGEIKAVYDDEWQTQLPDY